MQYPATHSLSAIALTLMGLLLVTGVSYAQVNTETMRSDNDEDGFHFTTNFNFSVSEGNVSFFNLLGNTRVDHKQGNNRAFAVIQYSRGVQNGDLFRNAGFVALRNTYNFRPAMGWEVFLQRQFNEFIRLRDRQLAGAGLRFRLADYENEDQNNKLQLILGIGGMYEYEDINTEIPDQTSLFRSTNYLSLQWMLTDNLTLSTVSYIQVALTDLSDFRNLLESTLEVKLTESLALTVGVNHRYDNKPPVGVEPYDIEVRNGLRLLF